MFIGLIPPSRIRRGSAGHRHPLRKSTESQSGRAGVETAGRDELDHRGPQWGETTSGPGAVLNLVLHFYV